MHRLRFLGTGDAFGTGGRFSQALWVEPAGGEPFLVDAGPSTATALESAGLAARHLSRLFVTHLHGDHIAGWPFLCLHLVFHGKPRERPFEVWGPEGVRERLDGLLHLAYEDLIDAHAPHFEVRWTELPVGLACKRATDDGLSLCTTPVDHHWSSLAYTFAIGRHRVSVTGDTRWCPQLEEIARRSTLLVLECTTLRPTDAAHVSLAELRERRDSLGSTEIVLVHLSDPIADALCEDPIPGVTAAHDGLVLELPA